MRCDLHCPKPGGFPVLAGLAVLAVAALAGWALSAASVWAGVVAAILAVDAAGCAVLVRCVRYGGLRKPRVRRTAIRYTVHAEVAAPPKAINAPKTAPGEVIGAEGRLRA